MNLDAIRREPFRLFFPLGIALSWAAVFHWLLLGLGVIDSYHSIFHAMTQVQGFLTSFVVGFLFTMLPRRTRTAPPSTWEIAICAAAPIATTIAAWFERWALAQSFWLVLVVVLAQFAVRRARRAPRGAFPPGFVWIAGAVLLGAGGSILAGVGAAMGPSTMWLHDLGRAFVLQGMLTAMILGVGSMLFPPLMRAGAFVPPLPRTKARVGAETLGHVAALVLFAESFALQISHERLGLLLRAGVIAVTLVRAGMLRLPRGIEFHRRLVWIAAWALAAGPLLQAAFPGYRRSMLHVTFIGGYALMSFAISVHVFHTHIGNPAASPRVRALAGCLAAALVFRILMDVVPSHFSLWIACAASCFLAATLAWGALVLKAVTHTVAAHPAHG